MGDILSFLLLFFFNGLPLIVIAVMSGMLMIVNFDMNGHFEFGKPCLWIEQIAVCFFCSTPAHFTGRQTPFCSRSSSLIEKQKKHHHQSILFCSSFCMPALVLPCFCFECCTKIFILLFWERLQVLTLILKKKKNKHQTIVTHVIVTHVLSKRLLSCFFVCFEFFVCVK